MMWGILITTLLGCMTGIPLILYGGLEMVMVGIACVVFCFLYTTLFSYHGLGDILVLLFSVSFLYAVRTTSACLSTNKFQQVKSSHHP